MELPKKLTPAEREILKLKIFYYAEKNEEYKKLVQSKLNEKAEEVKNNPALIEFGKKNKDEAKSIKSLTQSEYDDLKLLIENKKINTNSIPFEIRYAFIKFKSESLNKK